MPAQSLNHYTIKVRDLERTKDFYQEVVGLKVGDRPPLPFPGYWLYLRRSPDGAPDRQPSRGPGDPGCAV